MARMGSLINHLAANSKHEFKMPEVGTGVTYYSWSDRHAGTVTAIVDDAKKVIETKHDIATRTDTNGMSDSQSYDYKPNPNAAPRYYRWNDKKSQWESVEKGPTGRWKKAGGQTISLGARMAYHDYSF